MAKPVRILSLDGGGTWSIIQVQALKFLYGDVPGHQILRHFDWAFANSGGSLVLAALAVNKTPSEILALFRDPAQRSAMFVKKQAIFSWLKRTVIGVGARYRTAPKLDHLRKVLGRVPLTSIEHPGGSPRPRTHLVIVGFDYDRERSFFFRSGPSPRGPVITCELAGAVHASSTAPVNYFDDPAVVTVQRPGEPAREMRFWDGGVTGHNNPVSAAVAEALAAGVAPGDIAVLSLGTANVLLPSSHADRTADPKLVVVPQKIGFAEDLRKLASSVLSEPPDFASFIAHTALGGRADPDYQASVTATSVIRLNPAITPAWTSAGWAAPAYAGGLADFIRLIELDLDVMEQQDIALVERLCTAWLAGQVTNQPIRFNFLGNPAGGMHAEIGHIRFDEAVAAWRRLAPDSVVV